MFADTKTVRKIFRDTPFYSGISWTNNNGKMIDGEEVRTLGFVSNFEPVDAEYVLSNQLKAKGYHNRVKVSDAGYVRVMDCKFTPCGRGVYDRNPFKGESYV